MSIIERSGRFDRVECSHSIQTGDNKDDEQRDQP